MGIDLRNCQHYVKKHSKKGFLKPAKRVIHRGLTLIVKKNADVFPALIHGTRAKTSLYCPKISLHKKCEYGISMSTELKEKSRCKDVLLSIL